MTMKQRRNPSRMILPQRIGILLLAALVAVAALPMAGAHGGGHGGYQASKLAGDHYVTLEMSDTPLLTANSLQSVAIFVLSADGSANTTSEGVHVVFTAPDNGTVENVTLTDGFAGRYTTRTIFSHEGTWTANITVLPDNASAEFAFPVYADNPYVYESPEAEERSGMYVIGRSVSVPITVTYLESGRPAPEASDATALLERWTEDHQTKLDEREVPLRTDGEGRLILQTTFEETGMYHLYVATPTLGLEYDDRPYIHLYGITPEKAREFGLEEARESPGFSGAAAAVAVFLVVLLTRHRTR